MAEVGSEVGARKGAEKSGLGMSALMPTPETDEIGRYLEDTITIDWQTPSVMDKAKALLVGHEFQADRVRALFEFVRDEISHSIDVETEVTPCRASDVLREQTGLCYAKSHLLAAFLRYAGFPTGFCYVRLVASEPGNQNSRGFSLHGFNAVYWTASEKWIFLDPRGNNDRLETECRFEAPWSLAYAPDPEAGEAFLPFIYKRPSKRILDLLERAPDFASVLRNLPDAV